MSVSTQEKQTVDQALQQVGIVQDERYHIPFEEQRLLIEDAKAGVQLAKEVLLSQRLHRLLNDFLGRPEIRVRFDLEPQDVAQMGALAILEAVLVADTQAKQFTNTYQANTVRLMGEQITRSKLIPSVSENGIPVYSISNGHDDRMAEEIDLLPGSDPVGAGIAEDRTVPALSVEAEAYEDDLKGLLGDALENLSYRERRILELRLGLGCEYPRNHDEIGRTFNVSRERIRQIEDRALKKLQSMRETYKAVDYAEKLDGDNPVNMGLQAEPTTTRPLLNNEDLWMTSALERDRKFGWLQLSSAQQQKPIAESRWTPEQLARQQQWLDEITAKQDRGEIAFVKGPLLKEPLPTNLQKFLDEFSKPYWLQDPDYRSRIAGEYGKELRRLLEEAQGEPQSAIRTRESAEDLPDKVREELINAGQELQAAMRRYQLAHEAAYRLVDDTISDQAVKPQRKS